MPEQMWRNHDLKSSYDVVIVGGGAHGLATAYYLATRHGITNVAVLEQKYVGFGASGRNTAILRANYRTAEGIRFYNQSLKLYETLAQALDFNLMFSQQGHFTLGHSTASMAALTTRAEMNKAEGVDSYMVTPPEIKRMIPEIDISSRPRYPILGALYHPPGGIIRHDAVVWGFARGADRQGVHVHQLTQVEDILTEGDRIVGVKTNRGTVGCGAVVSATAGWSSEICRLVGIKLPIATHPLQAFVTQGLKPWLHHVVVSSTLHIYLSQSDRGELVCGGAVDSFPQYSLRSTLDVLESYAMHVLELFPMLHNIKVQRQWAGMCDMTPDYAPILSPIDAYQNFYITCGWGTWGFKAAPASGYNMAELVATGSVPATIAPFSYDRFLKNQLLGEKAAASVGS
ncbi:MAG: FAD-dependent oxidoreductase [Cyanobacteria bacterium Co-bin13]|nr:FAD-dependent oxidoreductase [Cyanobacteria bacterium Co-bin13]